MRREKGGREGGREGGRRVKRRVERRVERRGKGGRWREGQYRPGRTKGKGGGRLRYS